MLIVDVRLTVPALMDVMMRLGKQSNKAYMIVEYVNDTYTMIYHDNKYHELTQFESADIKDKAFQTIFVQNRFQQQAAEIEYRMQQGNLFHMELVQWKRHGTFWAKMDCLPFGHKKYYLVLIEDITSSQLNLYIELLEQKMFSTIESSMTFYEQMSFICSEMDELFYPYSYTTMTVKLMEELVTIKSNRFNDINCPSYKIADVQEAAFYKQLIETNEIIHIEDFTAYAINEQLKTYLVERSYVNCRLVPIVSKDEVIGMMTLFFDIQEHETHMYEQLLKRVIEIVATCYELNEQQLRIEQLAYVDQMTRLPNMHQFKKTLKDLRQQGICGIVKVVQASEFSNIVKLYGRTAGDRLLQQLGERFRRTSTSDIFHIARFTSSALIIFSTRDLDKIRLNPIPFIQITAAPIKINEMDTYITLKAGFALFNEDISCEDSIRFAEMALEKAKKTAGTQIEYYEGHIDATREREMQILNHLTEAIYNQEITTYFQPKVMLYRERIASVEALARWQSAELGFVSPAEFIPVAEQAGLICEIDLLMLEQVFRWMQQRLYAGKKILPVAINISPMHFYHPDFVMHVKRLLKSYYIDPQYIIIEVTESIGLNDLKRAKTILLDLHRLGIKTSVDDFGIGYSSLSYLQNFSFQELKIDRSFTWKLHEVGTYAIVKAIIDIARTLQMTVIAEGVETAKQVALLKELRCDIVQGYYYYKPMSMVDFERIFDDT